VTDFYKLPDGVRLPGKYVRTVAARHKFIEGAQDAAAGRSNMAEADSHDFEMHKGASAVRAYAEGYAAGIAAKNKGFAPIYTVEQSGDVWAVLENGKAIASCPVEADAVRIAAALISDDELRPFRLPRKAPK
jgi:ribosome modulation factor